MMPVSTPQNAVVYGSGMIPITKMVRSGIVFDIIGLILIVLLIPVMAGLILASCEKRTRVQPEDGSATGSGSAAALRRRA